MNTPYVKHYNSNGEVINPIIGSYVNKFPNRQRRHAEEKEPPFLNNRKTFHLIVYGIQKYHKLRQIVIDKKTGVDKFIEHYIFKSGNTN